MSDDATTPTPTTTTDDPETRTRTRTRSRRASGSQGADADNRTSGPATSSGQTTEQADDAGESTVIRRRLRRRTADDPAGREPSRGGASADRDIQAPAEHAAAPPEPSGGDAGGAGAETGEGAGGRRRSRSRGRRGGRRSKSAQARSAGDDTGASDDTGAADSAASQPSSRTDKDDGGDRSTPTRPQARPRGRRGGRPAGSGPRGRGRRPIGGVSEETRRAINEGPPRRMLVTVGSERTQIAVLEQRSLMEHYVTRKSDVSYVGNIYAGRVQNVLPGMEAAFIDIGKGRNGVLYAGEVNYDEADLDIELPRIEDQLKPGQTVLVQVTKDPMGTKGARLTQQLSIAGRFCVLAPGDGMLGISRKLPDEERERLRKVLKTIKPEGFGLIVRTAAEGATKEQLEADVARLTRIWTGITERAKTAKPLEPVYEEPNLVIRVIRDIFGPEYEQLIVDSDELGEQIRDYLSDVGPDMVSKVTVLTGRQPLFDAYEVTTQIRRALEKKVWLASGGYLIIEKTEAMWVIDVNTGKFVGKDNLEETVMRNNLEAAEEIAHQLRLRDMGGIIVIDFVDMMIPANRDEVLKRFKRELARDKTKSRVMDISKLGLVQMTRKNVSQGLTETFTTTCETCEGRGATILGAFN